MVGTEVFFGQSLFEWLSTYGYYIYPIFVIFLGPLGGIAGGFFASISELNPFVFFLIWLVTTTTTDGLLFLLGKFGRGFLNRFTRTRRVIERIDYAEQSPGTSWVNVVKDHYGKIFFIMKVSPTVAITDMIAVVGGLLGVAFRRHYIASIFGQIIWSGVFVSTGYYFGGVVQDVNFLINTTGIVLGSILILVFLYIRFIHTRIMSTFGSSIGYIQDLFKK